MLFHGPESLEQEKYYAKVPDDNAYDSNGDAHSEVEDLVAHGACVVDQQLLVDRGCAVVILRLVFAVEHG